MTLIDVIANLETFDREYVIFAAEPWSSTASAIIAPEPNDGNVSQGFNGHAYFLEIHIAREFLENWAAIPAADQSIEAKCNRLISYAINDA